MAWITRCRYTRDGQLLAPTKMDLGTVPLVGCGGFPTFDVGYYHRSRVETTASTWLEADAKLIELMKTFYRMMNQVEGFATLALKRVEDETPVMGTPRCRMYYQILYVIEDTGSLTQDPESPYAGYQRDLRRKHGHLTLGNSVETPSLLRNRR